MFGGPSMKSSITLGFAMLLALAGPPAKAALVQFNFGENNGGGYFQVDTTNLTIGPIGSIDTGNLLGGGDYTHYYPLTPGSSVLTCQVSCQAIFTTQGSGASSGLVTLTLSFANILDD